jgi:dienelactone hydrolase
MITVDTIEYQDDDGATCEAFVAYDQEQEGKRPGVLVVHDWMGVGPYVRSRAEQLAALGYVALTADIYGKGVRPGTGEEAAQLAGTYRADRAVLRKRSRAGLKALTDHPLTDRRRTAAIGYCFGGTAVLELARSGAEMGGFVTFHGGLETPHPEDGRNIRGKVLVLHGADDPVVPTPHVLAFQEEMRKARVDWQMVFYGGAVHAFSRKDTGNDPSTGVAYDEKADRRSWEAMKTFFGEIFG